MNIDLKNIGDSRINKLYVEYPWLKITTTVEDYVEPNYYDRLLKDYIFRGKTDLEHFNEFLEKVNKKKQKIVLELGCGSGRVTREFISSYSKIQCSLDLVDLSSRMLEFCKKTLKTNYKKIRYIKSDSVAYLQKTHEIYDIIFSLWSFSHSIHQILSDRGSRAGKEYIQGVIEKMVRQNMKRDSVFFLIHFDSLSDEQRILMRQWNKVFPIFKNINKQSPSKLLLDETFKRLRDEGLIKLKTAHFTGKAIKYSSLSEALEIFLNFHMESYFNESKLLPHIIDDLRIYFQSYTRKNGKIEIRPGCFFYVIKKIK